MQKSQKLLLTLASFSMAILVSGCGQVQPYVNTDTSDECATVQKKLRQVDTFTKVVNDTSAFHLDEAADAITTPGITVSNNKRQMLRDAKKKRAVLTAEKQSLGCKTAEE